MKRFRVALVLVVLSVVFGAEGSYAMCKCREGMGEGMQHGMHMGREMEHHGMGGMGGMRGEDHPMWQHLMGLGLDEKQREAARAIKHKEMKEMVKKKADKQIAKLELKEILAKDPVDMKAVEATLKQIEAIETDMHLSHLRTMEEVKAMLTPDQKKKMREMIERGPMGGGMGMMQGCGMMGGGMMPPPEKQEGKQPAMEHKH